MDNYREASESIAAGVAGTAARVKDQVADKTADATRKITEVGRQAADKVEETADYIRRTDFSAMAADVQGLVRRYPGSSLALAAVFGFLAAVVMRGQD
jgi:ElaB/YqjD/DUF883 family membrane-anchored ribosome-binding protein